MGDDAPGGEAHIPDGRGSALKPRVLIVDDDEAIRESLEMVLERRYQVATARNGKVALEHLEASPVDVVLLDLMMPVLDGAGFMAEARRRGMAAPVILMSAGTDLRTLARELGAHDFMQKPITLELLEQKIASALAGSVGPAVPPTIVSR
jgi:DNA-binding NtrC family response regulator